MTQPLISIIIPVLNAEKTISSALDSILQQSFTNYEILIFDGNSIDGSLEILKSFVENDHRIKLISEKDDGIYDAMNKGICKASGEWLYFLGSDDTLYNSKVFENVATMIQLQKEVRLVYGDVQLNKPISYQYRELIYAGEFDSAKLLKMNICHQAIFYHRSLFQQFGLYKPEYRIFADYDFNLRCFNKVKSFYLKQIIANFYVGGQSKNQQEKDIVFVDNFLENMLSNYAYNYNDSFFNARKRELFKLFLKQTRSLRLGRSVKTLKTLTYQTIKKFS